MHSPEINTAAARFVLDRREALPALVGRHEDFLIIGGLAGAARDIAALTENGPNGYAMGGAMGGACMIGLGLALARRDRRVLVVTGDGELLMNIGALATIAIVTALLTVLIAYESVRFAELRDRLRHQLSAQPAPD